MAFQFTTIYTHIQYIIFKIECIAVRDSVEDTITSIGVSYTYRDTSDCGCINCVFCLKSQEQGKNYHTNERLYENRVYNQFFIWILRDRVESCGYWCSPVITKWKSYFPVQHWCQSDFSCNLLLLQPRDGGSVSRFNSPLEPQLNSAAIKKNLTFWLQQILAEVLHESGTVRTAVPPVERTLKEHRGQAELRAKQEVRAGRDP